MRKHSLFSILLLTASSSLTPARSVAEEIRVAVASNFTHAIKAIARQYETNTGHKVTLIFGSTGKHYAQIINGAPFDAFFAADTNRPQLLDKNNLIVPGSRFTYAIGKVVLWSPRTDYVDADGSVLAYGKFRHLAIANPNLAPYGRAAKEILQRLGRWEPLKGRLVRGENIGQTFQFVYSGNAELGFVAYSQIKSADQSITGSVWQVPQTLYTPIEQQAVLLKNNAVANTFLSFVRSAEALKITRSYGYDTP